MKIGFIIPNNQQLNNLKQYLLLFDSLLIDKRIYKTCEKYFPNPSSFYSELEFLETSGILKDVGETLLFDKLHLKLYEEFIGPKERASNSIIEDGTTIRKVIGTVNSPEIHGFMEFGATNSYSGLDFHNLQKFQDFYIRTACLHLNRKEEGDYVPLVSNNPDLFDLDLEKRKENILKVILKNIPIPDDSVPWEQIIDFKQNEIAQLKLKRIRSWCTKMAYSKLSAKEIEQEIDYLIHEYEHHMALHKIKANRGTLKVFVISTLEIFENIFSFRWRKLGKQLFEFENREVELMINEGKAPGKEMALISELKNTYG